MRKWEYICIHHSATPDGKTFNFQAIRHYHTSYRVDYEIVPRDEYHTRLQDGDGKRFQKPWLDVGYHFAIEDIYDEWEVIVGRPLTMNGAHCYQRDMNKKSIGVCFIGNYDVRKPDLDMILVGMRRLLIPLCKTFKIPYNKIIGHTEVHGVSKSCPGKMFNVDDLRELMKHELK